MVSVSKSNIMEVDYFSDTNFMFEDDIRNSFIEFYSEQHKKSIPTEEAYLYFPKNEKIIIRITEQNYSRKIFSVDTFNDFEEKSLSNLDEYNKKGYSKKQINLLENCKTSDILRFLYANKFENEKTLDNISVFLDWKSKTLPVNATDNLIEILGFSGFCYCHGRDHEYRPNLFVRMDFLKNKNKFIIEDFEKAIIFLYEYIKKKMLIPGQIEQWNIFLDFSNIMDNDIKKNFEEFSLFLIKYYETRINKIDIFNPTMDLKKFFILLKNSVNIDMKLNIKNKNDLETLFENVNKEQIEKKYGGSAKDLYDNINDLRKNLNLIFEKNISNSSSDMWEMDLMIFFPPILPSKNYRPKKNVPILSDSYKAELSKVKKKRSMKKQDLREISLNRSGYSMDSHEQFRDMQKRNSLKKNNVFLYNPNVYPIVKNDKNLYSDVEQLSNKINNEKISKFKEGNNEPLKENIIKKKVSIKELKNPEKKISRKKFQNEDKDVDLSSSQRQINSNDNKISNNIIKINGIPLNDNSTKPIINNNNDNSKENRFKEYFSRLKVIQDEKKSNVPNSIIEKESNVSSSINDKSNKNENDNTTKSLLSSKNSVKEENEEKKYPSSKDPKISSGNLIDLFKLINKQIRFNCCL